MRVALDFRMYMMRFAFAIIATSFASIHQPRTSREIEERLRDLLGRKLPLPTELTTVFETYLKGKPGSPRYTPLRKRIAAAEPVEVETQDLWLSNPCLNSSVGALTDNYYGDPLSLAHMLRLVHPTRNLVLTRGRLHLYFADRKTTPTTLTIEDQFLLGLWLIDLDGDWIAALLQTLRDLECDVINSENRVPVLLATLRHLLSVPQRRANEPNTAKVRKRLIDLIKITERNRAEGLNLGQPWSWFMVPRLELLVDSGLMLKTDRPGLSGYVKSAAAEMLVAEQTSEQNSNSLLDNYFSARLGRARKDLPVVSFDKVMMILEPFRVHLQSPVGYFPLFESAAIVCVQRALDTQAAECWELNDVMHSLQAAARSQPPKASLGIDRGGNPYTFKPSQPI